MRVSHTLPLLGAVMCVFALEQAGMPQEPRPEFLGRPHGGPPEIALAAAVDEESIEVQRFIESRGVLEVNVPAPGVATIVLPDAIPGVRLKGEFHQLTTNDETVGLARVTAARIDGRKMSQEELMRALRQPQAVLLLRPGTPAVDYMFRGPFAKDAVVLWIAPLQGVEFFELPETPEPTGPLVPAPKQQ